MGEKSSQGTRMSVPTQQYGKGFIDDKHERSNMTLTPRDRNKSLGDRVRGKTYEGAGAETKFHTRLRRTNRIGWDRANKRGGCGRYSVRQVNFLPIIVWCYG